MILEKCVAILPDDMVVHRLTGDAPKRLLVAPKWSADKKRVLNEINKRLTLS
jgi:radical SAM superfamily enzyme